MKQLTFRFKFITTAVLGGLFLSAVLFSCKKDTVITPVDTSCLTTNVDSAQALYDGTSEGTKPGQYVIGSRTTFKVTLDQSIAVLDDANSSQDAITNACAQLAAAITTYQANLIQEIAAENLIGFWKFNGNANDSSGKGNNGTVTAGHAFFGAGIPTLTTDRFNRANMAYHFDKGGNIDVPYTSSINPTSEMSISVWFKKDTTGRTVNKDTYTMTALDRWLGYKFQLQSANKLFYTVRVINNGDTTIYDKDDETFTAVVGVWYHGVVTFKSGEEDFYVNGSLVKSWTDVPGTPITVSNAIDFVIGQDLPTSYYLTSDPSGNRLVDYGGFWTGDMDDVMFYNVALTAPQVSSIYTNQSTP